MSSNKAVIAIILTLFSIIVCNSAVRAQETETPGTAVIETTGAETEIEAAPSANLTDANQCLIDGDLDGAATALAVLQDEFPDDPRLLLMYGEVLLALRNIDTAAEVLGHGVEIAPELPRMHFQLAGALASQGKVLPAIEAFGVELELNQDPQIRHLAHMNRYLLYSTKEKWNEAASELEAALEINAEDAKVYGDLATLYLQAGRLDDCSKTLAQGLESGFQSAQHYYSLGARQYNEDQHEAAVKAFTIALEIQPSLAAAERSLAAALEKMGRADEMNEHLQRYLELAPDAPDAVEVARKIEAATGG
jgi:tetratricopeptide (TPR) repeat protein